MKGPPKNPRDERGWCVPREGTRSRVVYGFMCDGMNGGEIEKILRWKSARVIYCHIKDGRRKSHALAMKSLSRPEVRRVVNARRRVKYPYQMLKIAKCLDVSMTEARRLMTEERGK